MKLNRTALLSLGAIALLVGQTHAQNAANSNDASAKAQAEVASRADGWRYVFHNGYWWFYYPDGTWTTWSGTAWVPYTGSGPLMAERTAGRRYRAYSLLATGQPPIGPSPLSTARAGSMLTDALPGRDNPQMSGGGMGINGGSVLSGRNGGLPNIGGGTISRGSSFAHPLSDVDALPGRLNAQMAGGGLGIDGSPLGESLIGPLELRSSGSIMADALPGQSNPQMAGGGLGVHGAPGGAGPYAGAR